MYQSFAWKVNVLILFNPEARIGFRAEVRMRIDAVVHALIAPEEDEQMYRFHFSRGRPQRLKRIKPKPYPDGYG